MFFLTILSGCRVDYSPSIAEHTVVKFQDAKTVDLTIIVPFEIDIAQQSQRFCGNSPECQTISGKNTSVLLEICQTTTRRNRAQIGNIWFNDQQLRAEIDQLSKIYLEKTQSKYRKGLKFNSKQIVWSGYLIELNSPEDENSIKVRLGGFYESNAELNSFFHLSFRITKAKYQKKGSA